MIQFSLLGFLQPIQSNLPMTSQPIESFDFQLYLPPALNSEPVHVIAAQFDNAVLFSLSSAFDNFDMQLNVHQCSPYVGITSSAVLSPDNHLTLLFDWWLS